MKLYYTTAALPGQRWTGTQVDAKACAKAAGGEFINREVPVDKPNLLKFLNDFEVEASAGGIVSVLPAEPAAELDELEQAELRAVQAAAPPRPAVDHSVDGVVDYVLNRATVAQAEQVFAALGTRFKELISGR